MTLRQFIRENKSELRRVINRDRARNDTTELTEAVIREWIMNHKGLYNWARAEGVRI